MQTYEMMCIFDPKLSAEAETTGMVESILKEGGAADVTREDLGLKRLAYLINKKTEGRYFLFHFSLDQQAVAGIRKELGIKEGLLRHLIVRREA
ncbi:MAG TPA: 30S ribosomal protein S6 [Spirochaetota bacterium]|nr:30S ribosomal protein S6 [Spirochaetota bacterium]HPH02046.1 30S ribosomal protein S6 [Spirochaetota bacterium]HPN83619.1 30S ribosomal protein S6 [Spirochaetota bacterium]